MTRAQTAMRLARLQDWLCRLEDELDEGGAPHKSTFKKIRKLLDQLEKGNPPR
jgi:nitrate reductase assembly molybdenum cofactor insertion protein NarJ